MSISEKILSELPSKIDCFLVCASYEERCLSVYDYFEPENINSLCVFYFKQYLHQSQKYIEKYEGKFKICKYQMDISKPISVADALIDYFTTVLSTTDRPNVVIDISTFTRESLLIVIKYLEIQKANLGDVYIFYRVAEVSAQLSDVVVQIRSVLGYMGEFTSNDPLHLILLSGFEYDRAREIIDTLEPDFISIGYGDKDRSILSSSHEKNVEFTQKLVSYYSSDVVHTFCHSLMDPHDIKIEVKRIVDSRNDCNIVLVPLNNKLSTIGAGLAAMDDSRVQVCYAEMGEYNESTYSSCKDECYIYKLKIGVTTENGL